MLNKIKSSNKFKHLLVGIFYLVLTVIFTWPILPNIHKKVTDQGDPFFISWVVNSELNTIKSGDFKNFWDQNIFYPYKNTLAFSDHSLALTLEALPVSFFTDNPIFLANYLQLLSFFLSALFAYFLAYYYTKSKKAAFISGFLYGFASYHIGQISHIQVSTYQFVPLVILYFEKFLADGRLKSGLLLVLFFVLNSFVSIYHLGFVVFPMLIIFLVRWRKKEILVNKVFWWKTSILLLITSLFMIPFLYPYYKATKEMNAARPIEEHASFSANPTDYAIAPSSNLILGRISQRVMDKTPSPFWVEHTLYLGIFTMFFALLGFFSRKYFKEIKRKITYIDFNSTQLAYLITIPVCIILSFGPFLLSQAQKVKLPYYVLYKFIPLYQGVRVPTRATIITVLSLAILVGFFVLKLESIKKFKKYAIISFVFLILFIEHLSAPIKLIEPTKLNTAVFEWTRQNLDNESAVAHFPFGKDIEYSRGITIDNRRTLNGYSGAVPESYTRLANDFNNTLAQKPKDNLQIASNIGINYFIVHTDYLVMDIKSKDNLINTLKALKGIKFLDKIESAYVFDIKDLRNESLTSSKVQNSVNLLPNNKMSVTIKNIDTKAWVNRDLNKFNIKIKYYSADKLVGEKVLDDLIKPLYLKPQESVTTTIKSPKAFLLKFDRVETEIN